MFASPEESELGYGENGAFMMECALTTLEYYYC